MKFYKGLLLGLLIVFLLIIAASIGLHGYMYYHNRHRAYKNVGPCTEGMTLQPGESCTYQIELKPAN